MYIDTRFTFYILQNLGVGKIFLKVISYAHEDCIWSKIQ